MPSEETALLGYHVALALGAAVAPFVLAKQIDTHDVPWKSIALPATVAIGGLLTASYAVPKIVKT